MATIRPGDGMSLSVIICTRDRVAELERCLTSLLECPTDAFAAVDVVVVDDGDDARAVEDLRARLSLEFMRVANQAPGLYNARLTGLALARGEVVLFLDDDVTLAPEYLTELAAAYARHPQASGIGGVDQTDTRRSLGMRALHRLFLYDSGRPGELSASGFPGATRRWIEQPEDFASEYLHGCNMSFRKSALAGLRPVSWLVGYSLGEDLHVASLARTTGPLFVSPRLRVWHRQSRASRDHADDTGRAQTVNMFKLLRARDRSVRAVLAFVWTMSWFVVKDAVRGGRARLVPGYLRGVMDLVNGGEPPVIARS
ncbi:MAG TPA: glycosyltransferase family A protein [Gemmatimonadales bacterium]|nr:glycosyltransferase family A protein [Gemmatimonadales bacterium]